MKIKPRMKLAGAFVGLALLLPAQLIHAADPRSTQETIQRAVERGRELLQAGRYTKALKAFEKANSVSNEKEPAILLGLAEATYGLGNLDKALEHAEKALALSHDPTSRAEISNFEGIVYFEMFRSSSSEQRPNASPHGLFQPASLVSDTPELREQLGAAEKRFRSALELAPQSLNVARLNLARVLERQGRDEEATQTAREFLDNATNDQNPGELAEAKELICWHTRAAQIRQRSESDPPGPGAVTPPVKIEGPQPSFTHEARRAGTRGKLVAKAIINERGELECIRILSTLPSGLDQSALTTLKKWKFKPATIDGEPLPVFYNLSINFR